MSRITTKILCLTVCIILAVLTGCKEEGVTSQKQERLYAAENIELKKEMSALREQFKKDLAAKQQELDKCNKDKNILQQKRQEDTAKVLEESIAPVLIQQVQELTSENGRLKARIEELQKQPDSNQAAQP